ncbi:MAG TPA: hypothetical protein VFZ77_18290 [Acidimicrobiales bacterium]
MSRRWLTAAAVALAGALLAALAAPSLRSPGGAPPPPPPGGELAGGAPVPDDHALADAGHGADAHDVEPAPVVWYRQLATLPADDVLGMIRAGVGSDLPGDVRSEAAGVAARFVVADLTGEGREAFPSVWAGGAATAAPALACCTDVTVLASGAAGWLAEPPLVLALVVWTGTPVDGVARIAEREATFVFLRPEPGGGYVPVDASTVASWRPPDGEGRPPG